MDAASYTNLTRQSGLLREMDMIAHNIANSSTTGFRREGMVFSEYVAQMPDSPSLSMARGNARVVDLSQAGLTQTGGTYDLAIDGAGFFAIATPQGERLTRAGAFSPNAEGQLVTPDGYALLDAGGAAVLVPQDAGTVTIAADGTVSADGAPVAQLGLWRATDPLSLRHQTGTLFSATAIEPAEGASIRQGALEDSNVEPLTEIARMIEVQRAYDLGQTFLDKEDERIRGVVSTLGR